MGLFKPNVEKMEKNKDVKGLMKALKDKDINVRWRAVVALGKIGEPMVELLIQALKDKEYYGRQRAAKALGEIGDARAVEPLVQAVKDKDAGWEVQQEAAKALGEIKDARAVEPLIQALKDEDRDVRKAAKEALKKLKAKKG